MRKILCLVIDAGIDKTHEKFYEARFMYLSHREGRENETPCIYKPDARQW